LVIESHDLLPVGVTYVAREVDSMDYSVRIQRPGARLDARKGKSQDRHSRE
jgi:hypothetical protein